ncbi:MAG: hypothetical protein FWF60_08480, partial [Oscillospiraceae bacterium]|nr:hypothetical protein [Oscillospiraceae bacterium]
MPEQNQDSPVKRKVRILPIALLFSLSVALMVLSGYSDTLLPMSFIGQAMFSAAFFLLLTAVLTMVKTRQPEPSKRRAKKKAQAPGEAAAAEPPDVPADAAGGLIDLRRDRPAANRQ